MRGDLSTCIDNLKPCLAQSEVEEERVEGGEGRRGGGELRFRFFPAVTELDLCQPKVGFLMTNQEGGG